MIGDGLIGMIIEGLVTFKHNLEMGRYDAVIKVAGWGCSC